MPETLLRYDTRFYYHDCLGHEWFDVSGWREDGCPQWVSANGRSVILWDDWGWNG